MKTECLNFKITLTRGRNTNSLPKMFHFPASTHLDVGICDKQRQMDEKEERKKLVIGPKAYVKPLQRLSFLNLKIQKQCPGRAEHGISGRDLQALAI